MEPKQSLILYSKPGCHLCEGLQNKLQQLEHLNFELEIRDITANNDWFQAYQYEIPVLFHKSSLGERMIPRPSPRASLRQLEKTLEKYLLP